jgi:hypothetical protein
MKGANVWEVRAPVRAAVAIGAVEEESYLCMKLGR